MTTTQTAQILILADIPLPPPVNATPQKIVGRSGQRWVRGGAAVGTLLRGRGGWDRVTEGTMVRYATHASRPAVRLERVSDSAAAEMEYRARQVVAAVEYDRRLTVEQGPGPALPYSAEVIAEAERIVAALPALKGWC